MKGSRGSKASRFLRRCAGVLGLCAGLSAGFADASSAASYAFVLSPGPAGSHLQPYDGFPVGSYPAGTVMTLNVDTVALTVSLSGFFMPDPPDTIGGKFDIVAASVPSTISGTVVDLPGPTFRLNFNPINVTFRRADPSDFFQGTLTLALTTNDVSVSTAGGCERNQTFTEGIDFNPAGGPLELVAAQCPYTGFFDNNPNFPMTFTQPFRIFLVGTVPEPGTLLLVATGLLGMAWMGRVRVG